MFQFPPHLKSKMTRYCKCTNLTCRHPTCGKKLRVGGLEWVDETTGDVHTSVHCEYGTGYTVGDVLLRELSLIDDAAETKRGDKKNAKADKDKASRRENKKLTAKGVEGALTQEDVARDFEVSRQTVIKWEEKETESGPYNKSNKFGYYTALRLDPNLRGAYNELVKTIKIFRNAQREAKKAGIRFRVSFERFNEQYAKHNAKANI